MSRRHSHSLQPLPRSLTARPPTRRRGVFADAWTHFDRVQELGEDGDGHNGCVNALSWSDDGTTLLSGSDDKRICIWTPDTRSDAPAAQLSPHPLKLNGTIITGHRANIFSSRFLPNSGTPTIVSCAGDGDIRVFEVERLQPAEGMGMASMRRTRGALWGAEGPGVRVLRCHKNRTKRIATEASPFLFLSVSEDGTVRQHDLRRPHTCRDECPPPLFQAPPHVELYSLSVSPLTPHLFAVAGQTDCAYICDRRKPEHQTPSWGKHTRRAEQVTCVRRLALPQAEWESVERRNAVYRERHITCVKMSADIAGEVICSFPRHSTSLFSLNDSPAESSARVHHSSIVPPNPESNTRRAERNREGRGNEEDGQGEGNAHEEGDKTVVRPVSGRPGGSVPKRRISSVSRPESRPGSASRQRTDSTEPEEARVARATRFLRSPPSSPPHDPESSSTSPRPRERRPLGTEWEGGPDEVIDLAEFARDGDGSEPDRNLDDILAQLDWAREQIGDDEMELDSSSEDEEESEAEDEEEDDSDDDDDDDTVYRSGALSAESEFKGVDVLYPRRSFRGARNVETVKDCNFLGDASDKIASGSDDGNWFVWDKETGRLDGIWRGDSDIVNVMEQHPTLPVVAVSGIDNTVKVFAPVTRHPDPSFNLTSQANQIIERNLSRSAPRPTSMFADVSAIQLLANLLRHHEPAAEGRRDAVLDLFRSIGIVRIVGDEDGDGDDEDGAVVGPQRDSDDEGDDE
ncbi:hypothetical protein CcaverHIS002_0301810 [Cutaneotrichosporon cavernicola]|uniref:WD40 repeat-like protein n=1 Tax=Cutaneotrichosporon cavernicola TaxID=279322 RepID=A0AA48IAJ5_9TREE|nr:uncharacterized protein CcaverHIS019_0301750 [Cutaneotrichosporon cavernicola]BEI82313.1 hypothetical protein CcaverHIS002_0301810 [Cutaneotrichosporon cavernicola]BEI90105.1 hypothetical protein CcaverHIS019_0301750 [Cutaneotrichosporon cavernicola]BEI97883.1 hypothetical protein CcaverHIS631_0301820 [Cutaneotrichosporon cavernicola]BEJ05661.1 hypothetical protein CcaverHIS641_0301830 [Cutaneotrichosporon cavernicola]